MSEGKILIIDDSPVVLERAKAALEGAGYEVVATSQIVGNARHLPTCDLVIIDYHMPGIDGGEVLRSLKGAAGPTTQCLFYLYTSDDAVADGFARLGFDGSFTFKGDEAALVPQVRAVFRMLKTRALTRRSRG